RDDLIVLVERDEALMQVNGHLVDCRGRGQVRVHRLRVRGEGRLEGAFTALGQAGAGQQEACRQRDGCADVAWLHFVTPLTGITDSVLRAVCVLTSGKTCSDRPVAGWKNLGKLAGWQTNSFICGYPHFQDLSRRQGHAWRR